MKRTKEVMQRPLAFTLVELLVVISILGLLAGLSIPAISAARNSALTAASTGNLHQINIMMKSYLAENNNFYPRAEEDDHTSWRRTVWEAANGSLNPDGQWTTLTNNLATGPYSKVMWCPLMRAKYGIDSYHPWGRGNYSINQFFNIYLDRERRHALRTEQMPGKTEPFIIVGNEFSPPNQKFGALPWFVSTKYPTPSGWGNTAYAYGAGKNKALAMFIDGHVELLDGNRGNEIDDKIKNDTTFE